VLEFGRGGAAVEKSSEELGGWLGGRKEEEGEIRRGRWGSGQAL
jgi:hypothetical protein